MRFPGLIVAVTSLLLVGLLGGAPARAFSRESPQGADFVALSALGGDGIPGNASAAYHQLRKRGDEARPALRRGLGSDDWQQRLLSAVLFAQLEPSGDDLSLVCRILIAHLPDNQIRGDATLAGHGLIALGTPALPYVDAVSWHLHGETIERFQLAEQCERLRHDMSDTGFSRAERARSTAALAKLRINVAWVGPGKHACPELPAARPTEQQGIERLLSDLGHDERKGNAVFAYHALSFWEHHVANSRRPREWVPAAPQMPRGEALIRPLLWKGLVSEDRQRRQLCCVLLIYRAVEPTAVLLEVCIEALEQDEFGSYETIDVANANAAARYMLKHPKFASPFLHGGLKAMSETVRIRSAAILAQARDPRTQEYAPFLVGRLVSNDMPDDATLSGRSLCLLGPAALPYLEGKPVDEQQAHYFVVIRESIHAREADPPVRIPFSSGEMYGLAR